MRNPLPWIIGLVGGGTILVGIATYQAVFNPPQSELDNLTITVQPENLQLRISANGTVVPIQSVNISPKTAGRLRRLGVEQGMRVEEGQPLAEMDNDEIAAQGIQAQANLKQAVASLQEAEIRINGEIQQARARFNAAQASLREAQARIPTEIDQAQAQLAAAEERFNRARSRYERYQTPASAGAVSTNAFDDAALELRNAQVAVIQAQQSLRREVQTREPEIQRLQANALEARIALEQRERNARLEMTRLQGAAEAAQAQLQEVQIRFQDTQIRAPFAGIITQKYATPGSFVTPTTSVSATASATSASILAIAQGLEVLAKVPEVDVIRLQPGQPVEIIADAFPNQVFRGRVKLIAPEAVVEQNVTSFEVRIQLDETAESQLLSGMNVDVTFVGVSLGQALTVPTVAVVTEEGQRGVMVVGENNQPEFRPVVFGATLEDKVQVLSGLQPGERVFIDLPD
ncbi:efflux RND transporter periplasmic adaptor subunit [Spirulina subsalsa]|uniref:efflux RND transporter periplasmic adaptor subunit n=1 Tax=Spirulina subsalsa TaxID=54311 RepID=UPI0002F5B5A8|nr:efflux RND transporter periplasmic adaptor subunit [Spirulina subsalsa]